MPYQVNFPRFQSGEDRQRMFMQDVQTINQMNLQTQQAKQLRKQQEWENDFKQISATFQLASVKGVDDEDRVKLLNGAGPIWNKWNPNNPFPEITVEKVKDIAPLIKDINDLGKAASDKKIPWTFAYQEANSKIANFHARLEGKRDLDKREKAAFDAAMAPIKQGVGISAPQVMVLNRNKFTGELTTLDGQPFTGQVPKGTQIKNIEPPPGAADVAQRAAKLGEMNKLVDFFEEKINEVPSGEGFAGRAKGLGLSIEAYLQTDPQAAAYAASIDGLRSQIARGLGEVGNLAEQEQKYAISLMPKLTDNMETRKAKIQNFRDYIRLKTSDTKLQMAEPKTTGPSPITPGIQPAPSGKVRVTNGTETLEINATDLPAAQADGFKVLQ